MRLIAVVCSLFLIAQVCMGAISIIPRPVSVELKDGEFKFDPNTRIVCSGETSNLGRLLQGYLSPATGYHFDISSRPQKNSIRLILDKKLSKLGSEGYRLTVNETEIELRAPALAGLFYSMQSLRQLLPAEIFRRSLSTQKTWSVPCVLIEDFPRFAWRGSHMDVCRHFMPKEFIFKYLDLLALHKLNTFHWHLTDDQGWRIEILKYPRLTSIGAFRSGTMKGPYSDQKFDNIPHGGFYTQDDIREVVAYAQARFINVVPEIEMPGHSQAAIAAYPELGNTSEPQTVGKGWGVYENVFNVEDTTIRFLQNVLDEVIGLFPSQFIHIGGDEVPKKQWKESPSAQARMQALGLKDESELQSWFIHQMDSYLASKGRRLLGWDEILEGGLAPGATVMSWRGEAGGIQSAKQGHDVVMAPTTYTYFDFYQGKNKKNEPLAIGGYLPLEAVYGYNPIPAELTEAEAKRVLGAQFQLWSEYIPNPKHMEYMAFPRGSAFSEVVWSPLNGKNFDEFKIRLNEHLKRLNILDVNYRDINKEEDKPFAVWRPEDCSTKHTTKVWDADYWLREPGDYSVRFQYLRGGNRLEINWVELREDGISIARDEHPGMTGGFDKDNEYVLRLQEFKPGAKYSIAAEVRTDGGRSSYGEVYFQRRL